MGGKLRVKDRPAANECQIKNGEKTILSMEKRNILTLVVRGRDQPDRADKFVMGNGVKMKTVTHTR